MPFVLGDYIEIPAIDLDDAKAFYDTLFGWEYDTDHSGLQVGFRRRVTIRTLGV